MSLISVRRGSPLFLLPLVLGAAIGFYYWRLQAEGKKAVPLSEERRELVQSSRDQQFQKFSLTGFDEGGKTNWKLEGDTAKIDPGQTVFLDENVTLRLKDNTLIRTDHVQWSQGGGTLRTDALVTIEHENALVHGRGAYGRPNDGYIQLNRDIDMLINESTKLVCEGPLKMYYDKNTMSFFRKVKVTDARGTLTANRMDVNFDPETKRIREITAIGNVMITRGPDITRSRRAIYSVDTGSVRLEGSPEITLNKGTGGVLDGALRNQGA